MLHMNMFIWGEDEDVIQIHEDIFVEHVPEHVIDKHICGIG